MYVIQLKFKDTSISLNEDDIALIYAYEKQESAIKHLKNWINKIEKRCAEWKVFLNAGKTMNTIFIRHKYWIQFWSYEYD